MSGGRPNAEKKDITSRPKREDQARQKDAPSVSGKHNEKHRKDDSGGAEENTSKKQENSV